MPHPSKASYGGEDAFFVSDSALALGVADGVGGWKESEVNPAEYSKSIARITQEFLEGKWPRTVTLEEYTSDVQAAIACAHSNTRLPGSSTVCAIKIDPMTGVMAAANLGDSGAFAAAR